MSARWVIRRAYENARCLLGIHRLRGYQDCGDGVHVASYDPRGFPGPGCWRRCEWCGAAWEAISDGIEPWWRRIRPSYACPASPGAKATEAHDA